MTEPRTLRLAAKIARSLLADYAEYVAECEADRESGYRAHYCEHGTNQWTDYDNICGPCEDGLTMRDGLFRREFALDSAKRRMAEFDKIMVLLNDRNLEGIINKDAAYDRLVKLTTV